MFKAAKININCDKRAGEYRRKPDANRTSQNNPIMPTEIKVYFASKGQIIINKLEEQIMSHRHGKKLERKLKEKIHWDTETSQHIDWHNHGEAVRKQDKIKYLNITKRFFGW